MFLQKGRDEGALRNHAKTLLHRIIQAGFHQRRADSETANRCGDAGMGEDDDVRFEIVIQKCRLRVNLGLKSVLEIVVGDPGLHSYLYHSMRERPRGGTSLIAAPG